MKFDSRSRALDFSIFDLNAKLLFDRLNSLSFELLDKDYMICAAELRFILQSSK